MTTQPDPTQPDPESAEDLAQLLQRVMRERDLSQSEVARRVGVSVSAVHAWVHRERGTGRGPSPDRLRALAAGLGLPEEQVFAAVRRKAPGPLSDDLNEEVLQIFAALTKEQQRLQLLQMRALADDNRAGA